MAVHDMVIANGTGAAVRSDLNGALAALVSLSSSGTEPATKYAYQWWADTTTGKLKIRNSGNNAWIEIGTLASVNLGLAALAGATFTGEVVHNFTGATQMPSGTTAQRPGSPTAGDFRYNSTTNEFEGYSGSSPAWGAIGGGGGATGAGSDTAFLNFGNTISGSYDIPANTNALTAGPIEIASGQTVEIPATSTWTVI